MSDDDSFYERIINELDSEVMRLKTENTDFKKLITELCDALRDVLPYPLHTELVRRAREATR